MDCLRWRSKVVREKHRYDTSCLSNICLNLRYCLRSARPKCTLRRWSKAEILIFRDKTFLKAVYIWPIMLVNSKDKLSLFVLLLILHYYYLWLASARRNISDWQRASTVDRKIASRSPYLEWRRLCKRPTWVEKWDQESCAETGLCKSLQ